MKLEPGQMIRDYQIIRSLGEGGMGEVYLAEDVLLAKKIAIKRLNPELTHDPQFSERFVNEARIQARLEHENIVGLYSFFIDNGIYYMAMKFAEGETLKALISRTGPIPEKRTIHILRQILAALRYAHAQGVVHRDIKPSNIMIDTQDRVMVMDFGIARIIGEKGVTMTGQHLGTVNYMSPEQVMSAKDVDHRTDIYSAGVLLYEMLTGAIPYDINTESLFVVMKAIMEQNIPDPRNIYPGIGAATVEIMRGMVQKDKDQRFRDCDVILEQITGIRQSFGDNPLPSQTAPIKPLAENRNDSMVYVEGGEFDREETHAEGFFVKYDIQVVQQVILSDFMIAKFPVTIADWISCMGEADELRYIENKALPITDITWIETLMYCNSLSFKHGMKPVYYMAKDPNPAAWESLIRKSSGIDSLLHADWEANGYRLPTEAEWEFAAFGGLRSRGYIFAGGDEIDRVAWYRRNSKKSLKKPGGLQANELGLYDMCGNVWEWAWDYCEPFLEGSYTNPRGPEHGNVKSIRGGSFLDEPENCEISKRCACSLDYHDNTIGFRVARNV
ncbi:MAG TPA: bifunctional serine/threonine-protein kinase/formylglycine-generating enzyme family protein [Candidatus Cloacimonadota bacterium]|nr:bifunctional serine/threonine-protein kinase/formylglycine-generating enzyme family protein [Candidatus Cloacimonadota bacterium]